jgi:SanA protein
MKNVLIQLGVPQEVIYLDYAGFRTLDSVVRCKEVFDQDDIIVVSQEFHNQRAVFISQAKGVKAIGYNAKDVAFARGYLVLVREKLARVKAVLDLIVGKQPKFYGSKVAVGNA